MKFLFALSCVVVGILIWIGVIATGAVPLGFLGGVLIYWGIVGIEQSLR